MASNSLLWSIRVFMMLSLSLQVFLVLFAPIREKTANRLIHSLLSLACSMADGVVVGAMGFISFNQENSSTDAAEMDKTIHAFWVSFLLLHFGGSDTIISFSIQNESRRQQYLKHLILQISATIYVFGRIFSNDKSLLIPTMLVLLAGFIKCVERYSALWYANWYLHKRFFFCPQPYGNILEEEEARLDESTVVEHAHDFFLTCKIFIRDLILPRQQRKMSQKYFRKVSAINALRVMSVELHFMYELLYTKAPIIKSVFGYIFRIIAFTGIVMAFVLFNHLKKHLLPEIDVKITYSLLYGGIALEVIALFTHVFFDWPISGVKYIRSYELHLFLHNLASRLNDLRKPRFATYNIKPNASDAYEALDTPFIFRRWSESISTLRLLPQMLKRRWGMLTSPEMLRAYKYPLIKQLWNFIVKELRDESKDMDDPKKVKEIFEAKGDLFLKSQPGGIDCSNLLEYVTEASYEINVLVWHFATEISYQREKSTMTSTGTNDEMEFSKILSEYMLYILLKQPDVSSDGAGIVNVVYWEILFELRELDGAKSENLDRANRGERLFTTLSEADFETLHQRSWLKKAIDLAQKMETMECQGGRKWRVMSGVWIEMLSYLAIHTTGQAHMSMLSKGGELLTFVWLFMAHLGCVYKLELD